MKEKEKKKKKKKTNDSGEKIWGGRKKRVMCGYV
jgi:hypothetical protein